MPTFANGESAASVRTKINDAIDKVDGNAAITSVNIDGGAIDGVTLGTNSAVTEAQIDNININGNAIISTNTNGNIALTPNGTGEVDISKVDIDGGSIDGTTIGAASAAAGTFTTVTASGDVTIADKIVHDGDTDTSIRFPAADTVTVETSGAERLRVDSSGFVGIGTTSPASLFDIRGSSNGQNVLQLSNSAGTNDGGAENQIRVTCNGNTNWGNLDVQAYTTILTTNGSERMRIDASGNLGLGVTPSAWASTFKTLQVGATASLVGFNSEYMWLASNWSADAGVDKYITSAPATIYRQHNGGHAWFTAPSGTAGNAITFTQAMTLDANGNLGIGTTSPSADLSVGSTTTSSGDVHLRTSKTAVELTPSNSDAGGMDINVGFVAGGQGPLKFSLGSTERMRLDPSGRLLVGTTTGSGTDRIIVDTAATGGAALRVQNTGGTGSRIAAWADGSTTVGNGPNYYMQNVTGPNVWAASMQMGPSSEIIFFQYPDNSWNERMRIDSSGNLLVGTTSASPGDDNVTGVALGGAGYISVTRDGGVSGQFNRKTSDGDIILLEQDSTAEGSISVSGSTVSYNGGHLSRWAQFPDNSRPELLKGTVMSNLDQMSQWGNEDNEQLNCVQVSTVEGDANVAGAFVAWDSTDDGYNDILLAMTGDMVIRIGAGVTVARGDLLMSAGDGTAKPQGDDIVRSKTIAKVTSTHVSHTYADGSYAVPCVLMAC